MIAGERPAEDPRIRTVAALDRHALPATVTAEQAEPRNVPGQTGQGQTVMIPRHAYHVDPGIDETLHARGKVCVGLVNVIPLLDDVPRE